MYDQVTVNIWTLRGYSKPRLDTNVICRDHQHGKTYSVFYKKNVERKYFVNTR